ADQPFAAVPQVVGHFLHGLRRDALQAFVGAVGEGLLQGVVEGVEQKTARDGVGVIAFGQLRQLYVQVFAVGAQVGEVILTAAAAFHLPGIGEVVAGLPDEVQRDIGLGDVLFQLRAVA